MWSATRRSPGTLRLVFARHRVTPFLAKSIRGPDGWDPKADTTVMQKRKT